MKEQHNSQEQFPEKEVRLAMRKGIQQATARRKKSRTFKSIFYPLATVAAVFILMMASAYISPTIASSLSQLPMIGFVFEQSDEADLKTAQKHGLTSVVGKTKTVSGISVTIDEVLYDQNNITVGFLVESEKDLSEHYFGGGMDYTVDGSTPTVGTGTYKEEIISDKMLAGIQKISLTDEIPESFELGLKLYGENGEQWDFSIPIEQIDNVKKILVNHKQSIDDLNILVKDIQISPTGLSLSYESIENETDFDKTYGDYIEFKITDQKGREITGPHGGVSGELIDDKIVYQSRKQFAPVADDVTELTITPYIVRTMEKGVVSSKEKTTEITRDTKDFTHITFDSFTVKIQ